MNDQFECPVCQGKGFFEMPIEQLYGHPIDYTPEGPVYRKKDGTKYVAASRSVKVHVMCGCRRSMFEEQRDT